MAKVNKSAIVPFSAQTMFELVADVDSYKEFLPWCGDSRKLSRTEHEVCGEITVARAGVRQTFSTCNRLEPYSRMDLKLREGPFKTLQGHWYFTELRENACKVGLELEFEFSGRLITMAFGAVFAQIADSLVDAFCQRARDLHK